MRDIKSILKIAGLAVMAASFTLSAKAQSTTPPRVTQPIDETSLATLTGYVHPAATPANDRGPVDDSEPMGHILLRLQRSPEQQRELDGFVDQLHNPRSDQYHQWLTPEEFGRRFGPADEDVAAVANWLRSKGFVIEDMPASKTHITFTGTAGQMRDAFHVDIHHLSVHGEPHQAAMNEPEIPSALAPVIAGFRQLHDFFPKPGVEKAGIYQKDMKTGKTTRIPEPENPLDPDVTVNYNGAAYYEIGPQDFYTIYNESPLLKAGINGTGVTVAVMEETQIDKADVTAFRSAFGLPAYPPTPNSTAGGVNYILGSATGIGGDTACTLPPAASSGNANQPEASLDLEWTGAVAPKAIIDFVACGKKGSGLGSAGIEIAAEHIVNYLAGNVSAASLSYGECETNLGSTGEAYFTGLWEQYAAEGITAVVSSGDSGPDRCDQGNEAAGEAPSVNGFSSTAYNVSAGGTDFSDAYLSSFYTKTPATTWWTASNGTGLSSAKSYIPEKAWGGRCSDPLYASYLEFTKNTEYGTEYTPQGICKGVLVAQQSGLIAVSGGGGGVSTFNATPTWQSVYGIGEYSGSTKFRNVPDIAFFASAGAIWGHLLEFCDSQRASCDYSGDSNSFRTSGAGGTSFVAPQVTGLMALVNQKTGERQGQADYTLYNLAAQEYGTPSKPNNANLTECSGSAKGAEVGSSCIFYDIAADTPSLQGGVIASATIEPCYANTAPDCDNPGGSTFAFGLSSVPGASASTLAYYAGAGYDLTTGLGSVNISNLVEHWNSAIPAFPSSTKLTASGASVSGSGDVTLTATVTATGRGGTVAPAGPVEFLEGSTSGKLLGSSSIVPACTGSGDATACVGVAKLSLPAAALIAGNNFVVAWFKGDAANDAPSTSNAVTVADSNKTQTITFTALPAKGTYGAAGPFTLKATGGASGNPVTFTLLAGPGSVKGSTLTITGAGTVWVAANQAGNSTYAAAPQVAQSIAIAKATLTITAKNASRVYGAANPAFSYSATGLVSGDTLATAVTGAPSLTTTATATSLPGAYPITAQPGTLASANYTFVFVNGTLTITPKGTVAAPVFKPVAGTYSSAQSVTITDPTAGATIYYTTHGTTPPAASTKYTAAITVKATQTIKAIGIETGYTSSAVATAAYTIN